jgi:hypothetical protein
LSGAAAVAASAGSGIGGDDNDFYVTKLKEQIVLWKSRARQSSEMLDGYKSQHEHDYEQLLLSLQQQQQVQQQQQ